MSDPDRLVDTTESEVERLLLQAGHDGAPREARQRAFLAATGLVTASTLTAASARGAAAVGKAAASAKAASLVSLKWIAVIGLAGIGAVAGTVAIQTARDRATAASAARPTPLIAPPKGSSVDGQRPSRPIASMAQAPFVPLPPARPSAELVIRSPAPPPPTQSAIATAAGSAAATTVEVTMLDNARAAVTEGNSPHALSILDEYGRRFPLGTLAPEAAVLRIEALVAAGDRAAASRAAQSFMRTNPASPYARRIESLLGTPNP